MAIVMPLSDIELSTPMRVLRGLCVSSIDRGLSTCLSPNPFAVIRCGWLETVVEAYLPQIMTVVS